MQARPEKAKLLAVKILTLALKGVTGVISIHRCFGHAYVVHN
jgi:hypothetical protein